MGEDELTLAEYLKNNAYSSEFAQHYLLPMTAAIWSAPPDAMNAFPVRFLANFLQNHGLLQISGQPRWQTIPGGARRYLQALLNPLRASVRIGSQVTSVRRLSEGVQVTVGGREPLEFDAVVLASHAPHSLSILAEPTQVERSVLSTFQYQANEAYLHLDESVLPNRRRAWASWNYRLSFNPSQPAAVTYDLSRLQRVASPAPILQTLNPTERRLLPDALVRAGSDSVVSLFASELEPANGRRQLARWRMFVMACEELFASDGGDEWFVSHALLRLG